MSSGIVLPKEFVYPASAVVATFYLLFWQTMRVGRARRSAKIDYPQVYAENAEVAANHAAKVFNCTQRAHQNTLEALPVMISGTLITGLTYPIVAASLCGGWVFARILYTIGYSTGDPKKRNMLGSNYIGLLCMLGLMGSSTASVVGLIRSL
ncbi:membrane-associated proteins in eicosanoid and glutathione metabolism [Daedaleopsis nitida]|nr:membrane-associated proteins in eicosanoid and glutathione metabolism [Daedaleopsis nitida]